MDSDQGHSSPPASWTPPPLTAMPHHHRRRPPPSMISFLSPPFLIILFPIIIILFIFFVLPSFLSFSSNLLKPTIYVKKSWDSLNICLVLFAILCGIFARRNDDGLTSADDRSHEQTVLSSSVSSNVASSSSYATKEDEESVSLSQRWFGFSETKFHDDIPVHYSRFPATGMTRLRRSSSSYPDLRQESLWETGADRYQFRFFDDFGIDRFRSSARDWINVVPHKRQGQVEEEAGVKVIPVDTFEPRSSMAATAPPPKSSATQPPPPPPPPPPLVRVARQRPRRHQRVNHRDGLDGDSGMNNGSEEVAPVRCPPSSTPPPPPQPPSPSVQKRSEQKHAKSERRKSSVKKELAMVWATLSSQKKSKRRQKMQSNYFHNYSSAFDQSSAQTPHHTRPPPSPPPPPPPPPPPTSVFRSLFKKGTSKSKKVHSMPATPPPPPPLPPRNPMSYTTRKSKNKTQVTPPPVPPPPPPPLSYTRTQNLNNTGKPPLPKRVSTSFNEEVINRGNQSPLIPIPPPPPPPFRMPAMKFVVQGDFAKIRSNQSSRCGSPELEEVDEESNKEEVANTSDVVHGTLPDGPVFCPSPDVNVKAATFIARLRGEWKLEKLNSMKEKASLGQSPGRFTQT